MKRVSLMVVLAMTVGCSDSSPEPSGPAVLAPPPEGQGFQLTLEATVPPHQELWVCDVYRMPNDEYANVSWVETEQTPGTHHLTLSTLGLTGGGQIPHGRYDCNDLYGDSSLMENQIMFFGNQGVAEDTMHLPEGVAAQFPAGLDVVHEMHYVNTSDKPVELYSRVNAWTMPAEEVSSGIWGGSVRDENINIPPNSEHTEWSRCVFNEDVEVIFLASHTHALGIDFKIAHFDGTEAGEPFYSNTDWHIPLITQYEPPLVVKKGSGFEWSCTWKNNSPDEINYGVNSTDEMCNMAVVHTPFSLSAACEVVETSDGVIWEG